MPVPFKVKALYDYRSEEPDDLIFDNGQIITVTEEEDEDWYTGEYVDASGSKHDGIFPRNFVEKYEPVVPSRPARSTKKPAQAEASAVEAQPEEGVQPPTIPPAAHEPSKEAALPPPKEFTEPPAPVKAPEPATEERPLPPTQQAKPVAAKSPPPVVEKPSSFRDRIAAFNKPAAAPVTPFKPSGIAGGSSNFIKKPFVPPPPSRNAYIPPAREPLPQKIYRREEDEETEPAQETEKSAQPQLVATQPVEEDDQPKPTSLKERIALLQKQQMEQAQRHGDAAKKKDKPKRPSKPRTESTETTEQQAESASAVAEPLPARTSQEKGYIEEEDDLSDARKQSGEPAITTIPPPPARELVSDTNDADDSAAADTEDQHEISTEEERAKPSAKPIAVPLRGETTSPKAEEDEEDEDDTEDDDEDPEERRRRELRERMAKMSGGMGMMGMFGGGMPAARKPKPPKEERAQPEEPAEDESARARPVSIMALPGMSNIKQQSNPDPEDMSDADDTAQPTPLEQAHESEHENEDYMAQKPSRRSTERSIPMSPRERVPPPPPPAETRPEPPQSPSARPVPPPPPPTKMENLPQVRSPSLEDDDDDQPRRSETLDSTRTPNDLSAAPAPPQRAVPPPVPGQIATSSTSNSARAIPPVPMSPTSPQNRPPPPPPPGQLPSRQATSESLHITDRQDESDEEVTEYDGDYDTDIASSAKHKAALKSHDRDSSVDEGALSDAPLSPPIRPAPPPVPSSIPHDAPPPLPPAASRPRESVESPRIAPPPVPPPKESDEGRDEDYDPYRYSAPQRGLPGMVATLRKQTGDTESEDLYGAGSPDSNEYRSPVDRPPPPPPPAMTHPTSQPSYGGGLQAEPTSISGGLSMPEAPKQSMDLVRSSTVSRRSADVPRGNDHGYIAADIDLAPASQWYTKENTPPPVLQNRNDVLWEVESSTTQKRGGRTTVTRDVYVVYQDYSQSTINATYDPAEPHHVSFEQTHEKPPMPPRKDQLENASETFGLHIAKAAEKAMGATVGEGTALEFVTSLIKPHNTALMPVGTKAFGALVYANLANASTQQYDEIRPGDIISFRNAKFAGHKGGLHQKYSQDVGKPEHVGVVIDWDGTKKKIRAWEQGTNEKGKKPKIRDESYRVGDLKSGELKVWRVMPRSYVKWGTS